LGDFRARLRDKLRESRDLELEKLRQKWAPKLAQLQERLRRAEERAEREKDEYSSKKLETAVSMGASVLGALFGRKLASASNVGRAASVARSVGRAARQREDIARAEEGAETIAAQLKELEAAFNAETEALRAAGGVESLDVSEISVAPRKGDLSVDSLLLLWVPRAA
jgi:DNA repair exonuclease SbcCD ATPase subunit